jgi:hypothetical protein
MFSFNTAEDADALLDAVVEHARKEVSSLRHRYVIAITGLFIQKTRHAFLVHTLAIGYLEWAFLSIAGMRHFSTPLYLVICNACFTQRRTCTILVLFNDEHAPFSFAAVCPRDTHGDIQLDEPRQASQWERRAVVCAEDSRAAEPIQGI